MKYTTLALLSCLMLGCSESTPDPAPTPIIIQPIIQPPKPDRVYSESYVRGYNDGYAGNWLAPINWVLAQEYRAGWSSGNRDKIALKPNRFEN